jgi:hypothetical protein
MLVVIRQALPDSALDKEYRDGGERPHVEMNAEELAQKYNNDQDIQNVIKKNTFEDPRYTRFVAEYLIKAGQERNIFAKTFNPESILQDRELFKSQSVEQIVTALVKKALSLPREERDQILNMKDILVTKMATYHLTEATYELLKGADKDKFQDEFIRRMVNHIIPTPSTDASAVRFEFDHAVRNAENHIRETDRKALIRKKTGRSVAFTEKTIEKVALEIADAVATGKALDGVAEIEDRMTKLGTLELANSEVATATKKQRWEWRMQMVKYIYIDLFTGLFGNLMKKLKVVGPKAQIGNTRFDPSRGTFYLMTNERAFRLMMQKGIFKKLITDKDVEALKTEHAARMKQLSDAGFDVKGAIERLATEQEGTPFEELVRGTSLRASSAPQCREIFLAN